MLPLLLGPFQVSKSQIPKLTLVFSPVLPLHLVEILVVVGLVLAFYSLSSPNPAKVQHRHHPPNQTPTHLPQFPINLERFLLALENLLLPPSHLSNPALYHALPNPDFTLSSLTLLWYFNFVT